MRQRRALVLKQLVTEKVHRSRAVEQSAADDDQQPKQLVTVSGRLLTAAHHGKEAVNRIHIAKVHIAVP